VGMREAPDRGPQSDFDEAMCPDNDLLSVADDVSISAEEKSNEQFIETPKVSQVDSEFE